MDMRAALIKMNLEADDVFLSVPFGAPVIDIFCPLFDFRTSLEMAVWRFRSKGPQKTDDYFGVKPPKKGSIINKKGRELGSRASIFRSIATQLS